MKIIAGLFLSLSILFTSGCRRTGKSEYIALPLSEEELQQAIDFGVQDSEPSLTEFVSDWTVNLGYNEGAGSATIITPFLRVALFSKQAALLDKKIDREMLEKTIIEDNRFLNFEVTLFGGYPQFGRSVKFMLEYENKEYAPSYMFMPPYSQIARDYTQIATGKVKFKREGIPDNAQITLIATFRVDPDIEESYTAKFDFDLGRYR